MPKVIFLDVDGTLVDYSNYLPATAVDAIRRARAKGHKVYICTGRSRAEVYPNLWEIGLDGMIGGNGSYIEDHGQVVFHHLLSASDCREIVDWLMSRGLVFYLESNSGLYGSPGFETGAEAADTLAWGDSMNDIEIIEAAGIGVAMGNAEKRVKEIADVICESVEEDGVAKEMKRQGLI